MVKNPSKLIRTPTCWFAYSLISLYAYFLNLPGSIIGYLREEFQLSYTAGSMQTSAFALGILVAGFLGGALIRKTGHKKVLAIGALGLGAGGFVLSVGHSPIVTILGLFLMGLVGTLILAIYPAVLDTELGPSSPVGISEANLLASILTALGPLLIGLLASRAISWRPAVLVAAMIAFGLGILILKSTPESKKVTNDETASIPNTEKLPKEYWTLWIALVVAVSIEFCTVYWSADYIEKQLGLAKDVATQAMSLFLIGMIAGRFSGSRLIPRIGSKKLLLAALSTGLTGFVLLWTASGNIISLSGLAIMGLGVANLYPTILAMAIRTAGVNKGIAGSRATLASGSAIFFLPLLLGSAADQLGIRTAFLIVGALFILLGIVLGVGARPKDESPLDPVG